MNKFKLVRAGIHVNEGIERVCGDEAMYESILLTFPDDAHYEQMNAAIQAGNVTEAFNAAHALKGISGNLAMVDLYEAICPLVETLRSGSLELGDQWEPVKEAYEKAYTVTKAMKDSQ